MLAPAAAAVENSTQLCFLLRLFYCGIPLINTSCSTAVARRSRPDELWRRSRRAAVENSTLLCSSTAVQRRLLRQSPIGNPHRNLSAFIRSLIPAPTKKDLEIQASCMNTWLSLNCLFNHIPAFCFQSKNAKLKRLLFQNLKNNKMYINCILFKKY